MSYPTRTVTVNVPRTASKDKDESNFWFTLFATTTAIAVCSYASYKLGQKRQQDEHRVIANRQYEREQMLRQKTAQARLQKGEPPSGKLLDNPGDSVKIDRVYLWEIEDLRKTYKSAMVENEMQCRVSQSLPSTRSPLLRKIESNNSSSNSSHNTKVTMDTGKSNVDNNHAIDYNKLISDHDCVISDIVRKPNMPTNSVAYVRAGPRRYLHFDPLQVNAAIVTCGGLCPGLNNVVREITNTLHQLYAIQGHVYGIQGGFAGFYDPSPQLQPVVLTPELVENIHHEGGTVLGSSRGGFDLDKIIDFLRKKSISQLYVIGGDGTHRAAFKIHEGCLERGLNISVAGIPKTIDNDVDYIDHSFGFSSAVEAAQYALRSAKTEAVCNLPNGVGVVKLMGRSAGFIAAHATMSSTEVDLCLVPEVPIVLEGENGCLPHLYRRIKQQGYAVVVVAEGAGEELLGTVAETDASGNKVLPPIGQHMKKVIEDYFKKLGETATVKYIDPSYMVRSVPANAADSLYCMQLAQNAVHGAMAGYTGFSVGLCNNRMVFLPIPELVATSPRSMNPYGRTWERVLAITRQPNTVPPTDENTKKKYESHAPMLR